MAEAKTKATNASVDEYLASRASAEQLRDWLTHRSTALRNFAGLSA